MEKMLTEHLKHTLIDLGFEVTAYNKLSAKNNIKIVHQG
jgi:hypothetical protein